jgi:hypothetical protein
MDDFAAGRKENSHPPDARHQQHQDSADVPLSALDYAARGWAVFPCLPQSKEPATRRGFKDATTNPATIRRWWLARPDYNIGIATGVVSGVLVLDVDGSVGVETLLDLEERYGALPETACSVTSSGCHLWFIMNDAVPSTAGRLGDGLDIRADGGYVIAPPSIHPDGSSYRWLNATSRAPAPSWLIRIARTRPQRPAPSQHVTRNYVGRSGSYGNSALESEIDLLAKAPPGTRNHALNKASFSLHQLVAGGELDGALVHDRLVAAATANGLMADPADGPRSVERTIASGAKAGLLHPRSRGGLR